MPVRSWILGLVSALVITAGVIQLGAGPGASGVTIDEPIHLLRAQAWLDGGDYVPEMLADTEGSGSSKYVYGPAFSIFAHTANSILGNEAWDAVSFGEASVTGRHLSSAFFALLAALLAGLATGFATGSRLIGLWTAACVLAIPIWTGMGFFNPKDTPVAAGYTCLTAALVMALRPGRSGWRPGAWDVVVFAATCTGVFFAVGTRLAMWLPLLISGAVFAALCLQRKRAGGEATRWPAALAGALVALLALLALYPEAFAHPVEFITRTVGDSSEYAWTGFTLTAGRLMPEDPAWWYLPAWTFASIPLLIGAAALGGIALTTWKLIGRLRRRTLLREPLGLREAAGWLVMVQLLLLPLGSIVTGSTMYTGIRQHLYLVPAVAMAAGLGVAWLLERSASNGAGFRGWLITAAMALALVVPMAEQVRLFPFNYVYVNPVAGLGGVNDRWEGDYWMVGLREASGKVPDGETAWCGGVYGGETFDPGSLNPCSFLIRPYALQDENVPPGEPGQRWSLLRRRAGGELPEACAPAGNVTRQLRGETIVIYYVARC